MNDETKAELMKRTREWLQSCVNAATRSGVPEEADLEAFILAHIDGEHARLAAAREEQREWCARRVGEESREFERMLRKASTLPTPLTDEARTLREALERANEGVRYWTDLAQAEARDAAALRARVAELEAEVSRRDALIRSDGYDDMRAHAQELARRAEKAERERDELREHTLSLERQVGDLRKMYEKAEVQVAAARAMCLRFNANPESAMPSPVSMVLRAMDGAAK